MKEMMCFAAYNCVVPLTRITNPSKQPGSVVGPAGVEPTTFTV